MNPLALAHPGLLWTGIGLVSVPILIHLFFRRRHRVVRWAAMDFLLAALRKQKRRVEVENLILLLLRCALIALLALAIARPAVEAASLTPFGGPAHGLVLLVDTSASMGAYHTGRRSLDRARERAAKLLSNLPGESRVSLVVTRDDVTGGAPRALLEDATPEEVRQRLGAIHLSHGPNDLGEVFRFAGARLDRLRGRRLVVFVTDLQQRDWIGEEGGRREDVFRALRGLERPGDKAPAPVVVHDVSGAQRDNVVVTDFRLDEGRLAFAGTLVGLTVKLANFGTEPAAGTLVLYRGRDNSDEWERKWAVPVMVDPTVGVGRAREKAQQLHEALPPGSEGPARFKVVFEPSRGDDDRLVRDNERYLALDVKRPVVFLPVRSATSAVEILRDTAMVEVMEMADPVFAASLSTQDLSSVDIVVWADAQIHELDARGVRNLEDFVRRGGGLLAYLGEYALPEQCNEFFFREKQEGLFPMRLVAGRPRLDEEHPVEIDVAAAAKTKHPLFLEMDGPIFGSPEVIGFRPVEEVPEASIVARYTSGEPAVLEHRLGRGRVVMVTTTPDERWFRLNGSLTPSAFFFNAAHYLVAEDAAERNVLVGMPLLVPLRPGARTVAVEPPPAAGGRSDDPVDKKATHFTIDATAYPGFYRVTVRGVTGSGEAALPKDETTVMAVNLDPGEGDLRRSDAAQLHRVYDRGQLLFSRDVDDVLPRVGKADSGEISRALLALVAILLLVELLLAWRFGNRRRAA